MEIPYNEWHPAKSAEFWQRLEVPGHYGNGRYHDEDTFDREEFWYGAGQVLRSHRQKLEYFDRELSAAFVIEHYLRQHAAVFPQNPRILEIGTWPLKNDIVDTPFANTIIALLAQNPEYKVVGVDLINILRAFPYKAITFPYFGIGHGMFINGDFHNSAIRQSIIDELGGRPNLIVGNMVFERRLGNWLEHRIYENTDRPEAAERLSRAASDFLDTNGVLVVCNPSGRIPDFVQDMPLLATYLDETDYYTFAEVRQKVVN